MSTHSTLKRTLSTKDLVVYGLVFMIPLAPAAMYGVYLGPSNGMVALCYLIGMAAMLFTGMSYRSMAREYPLAGSVYLYVQKGAMPQLGFLTGWSILLDYFLMPATVVIIGSSFANALLPTVPTWIWALAFIIFSTVTNILGVNLMSKCSWILFALQILVIVAFVACTIHLWMAGTIHFNTLSFYNPGHFELSGVLQTTGIVILSYLGFDAISTLAEETVDPEKSVGRAIIWAILLSGGLFIAITFLAGMAYPNYQNLKVDSAFIDIVSFVGGKWLTVFTTIVLVLSFGVATCQTSQAAVARVLFAMGRDGALPKQLSYVSQKHQTPFVAITFVGLVITPISLLCSLDLITTMVSFGALFGFILLNISVIWKFYRLDKEGRGRNPVRHALQYLISPLIGLIVTGSIFINLGTAAHIVGFTWLAAGVIYLFILTKGFRTPVPQLDLG
ncbi:APC family permease [Desulfosporosinus sp. OT]|uniref:APC family permease n=1 Tax=Desulfosporosinus sp. OT TaxID=913865 RepID=UPI000223B22D|nr:APC family permease [Desulfosporosinus sp. OT]EGW38781.1 amino acid permease family protein [Desulfosporosinus sp. OT]